MPPTRALTGIAYGNWARSASVTPSSSTEILYSGALSSSLSVSSGIQPQFAAGALDVTEA